jgi:hypothetical protein
MELIKHWEKWLFLFCLWVGLCGCGKTKCATCAAAKKLKNKKCAVAKIKLLYVGFRNGQSGRLVYVKMFVSFLSILWLHCRT